MTEPLYTDTQQQKENIMELINVHVSIPKIKFTDDAKYYVNYGVDGFKEAKGTDLTIVALYGLKEDGKVHLDIKVKHAGLYFNADEICERYCQSVRAVCTESIRFQVRFENKNTGKIVSRCISQDSNKTETFFHYDDMVWFNENGNIKSSDVFNVNGEYTYNPLFEEFTKSMDDVFNDEREAMFWTSCKKIGEKSIAECIIPTEEDMKAVSDKLMELKVLLEKRNLRMLYDQEACKLVFVKSDSGLPEGFSTEISDSTNGHDWSFRLPDEVYGTEKVLGYISEISYDYVLQLNYCEPEKEKAEEGK